MATQLTLSLKSARQSLYQGDITAAKQQIKTVLDQDFYHGEAWKLMYEAYKKPYDFPSFQRKFTAKFYPQRLSQVPFCPDCQEIFPTQSHVCPTCGYGASENIRLSPPSANLEKPKNPQTTQVFPNQLSSKPKWPLWLAMAAGVLAMLSFQNAWGFFMGFWVGAGYVGFVWLYIRGYMRELFGCMILAGGAPFWFPIFFGAIILAIAYYMPMYPVVNVRVIGE
ncbi:MAG: hypothetical protein MUF87_21600 [Anaerolineae bacterium]|jgi:ribosomal protein L37E|nr:hypothetical protein [Anaerolineae bacterium]